ncbi:MAG: BolA/IbaG family iron-sulfur metabolism protein [Porticoccaceae bacterium]|nr:BolA/IbaG family iron-sulfur metabolism protein [Porticoccaceae bacterium]
MGSVEGIIRQKLEQAFSPAYLEVINESASHSVPEGSESHFKVVMVTDRFVGKSAVQRHQAIYAVVAEQLQQSVHALALHTYAPDEWSDKKSAPDSPPCLGGSK